METQKKFPSILTKNDYFSIEECHCGKPPFKYHNTSKNIYVSKCNTVKEEYDIKARKWFTSKKQPCDFHCVYYVERPVFREINNILLKKASTLPDKNKVLEEKLRLLFQFVFVSNHTSTLDEINILVEFSLKRDTRKKICFPGTSKFSHYESLEEYRDRIFSKKIIDLSHVEPVKEKYKLPVNTLPINKLPVKLPEKQPKKKPPKSVIQSSSFIVVSDQDSDGDPENESDRDSETSRELSDYDTEEDTEPVEEEIEETFEEENFDDYDEGGDCYGDYD
jgi:hypothetical protein